MYHTTLVQRLVASLMQVESVKAVVLGGSYASGSQRPDSDIDLGLYYSDDAPIDIAHLQQISVELNDFPDPIVTNLGEWGRWVNGGASSSLLAKWSSTWYTLNRAWLLLTS